jgi:hypothetical protein
VTIAVDGWCPRTARSASATGTNRGRDPRRDAGQHPHRAGHADVLRPSHPCPAQDPAQSADLGAGPSAARRPPGRATAQARHGTGHRAAAGQQYRRDHGRRAKITLGRIHAGQVAQRADLDVYQAQAPQTADSSPTATHARPARLKTVRTELTELAPPHAVDAALNAHRTEGKRAQRPPHPRSAWWSAPCTARSSLPYSKPTVYGGRSRWSPNHARRAPAV